MLFRTNLISLRLIIIILPLYNEYATGDLSADQRSRIAASTTATIQKRNTLVLVDDYLVRDTHSRFFRSLRSRGHKLTFRLASDGNVTLHRYNERRYDNVILFAPAAERVDGRLDVKSLLRFVDDGGNLLVAVDEEPGIMMRELAVECGIEMDAGSSSSSSPNYIVDHFRHVVADPTHTTLAVHPRNLIRAPTIVGPADAYAAPILYRGIPLLVNEEKPEVVKVLTADGTCFLNTSEKNTASLCSTFATLVAAAQMINNSRVVFSGSLAMFSDAFASREFAVANDDDCGGGDGRYAKSANDRLTDRVSRWAFQETGVLRVNVASHRRAGERHTPSEYTINEMTIFEIELAEKVNDEWVPFDAHDLFVDFTRIDPFVRIKMTSVGDGRHRCTFKVPDVYGVFKFVVDYKRVGYSFLLVQIMVPVRPVTHTQYERFLLTAYPYYVAAFSMMIMTFVFSCVYLHADLEDKRKNE